MNVKKNRTLNVDQQASKSDNGPEVRQNVHGVLTTVRRLGRAACTRGSSLFFPASQTNAGATTPFRPPKLQLGGTRTGTERDKPKNNEFQVHRGYSCLTPKLLDRGYAKLGWNAGAYHTKWKHPWSDASSAENRYSHKNSPLLSHIGVRA